CMKLIHIDNVKPTKTFHHTRSRYVEIIKSEDLMQKHWDQESADNPLSIRFRWDKSLLKQSHSE
ncbi:302_t:CDS:2, partial [Diversispora eburnea]